MTGSAESTVLITGATDGLGLALADLYATRQTRLVLVGRRPLAELSSPLFGVDSYCQSDLARPESAQRVVDWLASRRITGLDVVIHNAAIGSYGPIEDQTAPEIDELLAVNLMAPVALTHALIPHLRMRRGKLVFISSVVSHLAAPMYAVYAATKAGINEYARALRQELTGEIHVQLLLPGATRTGLHSKSGIPRDIVDPSQFPPATRVAAQLLEAIDRGQATVTIGRQNRLLVWAGRHLGSVVDRAQERRLRQ